MRKHAAQRAFAVCVGLALAVASGAAMVQSAGHEVTFESVADPVIASPVGGGFPLQLVLDDGTAEGTIGVNGAASQQFLWFN
jgi:hypothetical protein